MNKVFAVKKNSEWWAVIDCGLTADGGMTVSNYWLSHFKKDERTYRWFKRLIEVPHNIQPWQEIKVEEKLVCVITHEHRSIEFQGWEDKEDLGLITLQQFAKTLGKDLTLKEIIKLIE